MMFLALAFHLSAADIIIRVCVVLCIRCLYSSFCLPLMLATFSGRHEGDQHQKKHNTAVQRVHSTYNNNNIPIMIKSALGSHTARKYIQQGNEKKIAACIFLSLLKISPIAWPIWVCISCKTKALASSSRKRSPALLLFSPFFFFVGVARIHSPVSFELSNVRHR